MPIEWSTASRIATGCGLIALIIWRACNQNPVEAAPIAMGIVLLSSSNAHFWYIPWMVAPLVLSPSRPLVLWSITASAALATWVSYEATGVWREFIAVYPIEFLPVLGVLSALAIYGVRRYLAASKVSEAKNSVGTISRSAQAAYERASVVADLGLEGEETAGPQRALCGSAIPVPAGVPAGKKYQPMTVAGADFKTGSATEGWRCLKFGLNQPHYYQYSYQQGSGYVSSVPPGANGYEAVARGDLDGDGIVSVLVRSGEVDAVQSLTLIHRSSAGVVSVEEGIPVRFVPMVRGN